MFRGQMFGQRSKGSLDPSGALLNCKHLRYSPLVKPRTSKRTTNDKDDKDVKDPGERQM